MKRPSLIVGVVAGILLIACSHLGNEEACDKVNELCRSETACAPAVFDDISNSGTVKDCIERATHCSAATACLRRAIPDRP